MRAAAIFLAVIIILLGSLSGWMLMANSIETTTFGGGGYNTIVRGSMFHGLFRIAEGICLGAGLVLMADIRHRLRFAFKKGEV